tara:strand:+ start:1730 stop:2014 length:285 start_codon:yes stop_codon:yes gene_type:complete
MARVISQERLLAMAEAWEATRAEPIYRDTAALVCYAKACRRLFVAYGIDVPQVRRDAAERAYSEAYARLSSVGISPTDPRVDDAIINLRHTPWD